MKFCNDRIVDLVIFMPDKTRIDVISLANFANITNMFLYVLFAKGKELPKGMEIHVSII